MGKAIIKAFLQFILVVINLDGITALLWKYDIFHHKGAFTLNDFYVGERRDNKTIIEKATTADSKRFLRILEQRENGYNLNARDIHKLKLWPKAIIPYYIDPVSYDKDYRTNLRKTLTEISSLSGIHFKELKHPPKNQSLRYVNFENRIGSACTHSRFTIEQFTHTGPLKVVLGFNSLSNGDMYPFVLAAAGIPPQNNAPFRDYFISIVRENIITEKLHLFDALRNDEWLFHDLPYDFASASHFNYHEYTRNGQSTLKPKYDIPTPTSLGFTFYDIVKMRRTYHFITDMEYPEQDEFGKPSYMYPKKETESSDPHGLEFGNPDSSGSKSKSFNHNFKTESKSKQPKSETIQKSKSKYPKAKRHKLNEKTHNSHTESEYKKKLDQVIDLFEKRLKDKMKKKNREPRVKPLKFIGFADDNHGKQDEIQVKDKEKERNVKKKGIPRPKPNKYLGILGDDPAHDQEEYKPQKKRTEINETMQAELSEDIDVYLSESSEEVEFTIENIQSKKSMKSEKRSTNNINV